MALTTMPPCPRLQQTTAQLALSVTVDDALPRHRPIRIRHLPGGHCLIVIRAGLDVGTVERLYRNGLRGPVRTLVYRSFEVPDPNINPALYARLSWWDPDWPVDIDTVVLFERRCRLTPWPHGAADLARFRA